jgi:hypothetical protein
MAYLVQAGNASEAWLAAMELMLSRDGKAVNLNVVFPADADGHEALSGIVDGFIAEHNIRYQDGNLLLVETVANTIFPQALYHPHLGEEAASRLYENYALSMRIHRRRKNDKETYFNRLLAYPVGRDAVGESEVKVEEDGTWNQLAYYVERLRKQRKTLHRSSSYELGVSHPLDAELRVQAPFKDKRMGSFPCLSHISLTLVDDRVHMSAVYRNQTFITRALGNYLGLARLLEFIATETGAEPGELQVLATHADAETTLGIVAIRELVERSRGLIGPDATQEAAHVR